MSLRLTPLQSRNVSVKTFRWGNVFWLAVVNCAGWQEKLVTVVCLSALAFAPLTAVEAVSHFATLDGNKIHYAVVIRRHYVTELTKGTT
jgi:hypothetical protein